MKTFTFILLTLKMIQMKKGFFITAIISISMIMASNYLNAQGFFVKLNTGYSQYL